MIAIGIRYLNGWSMAAAADGSDKSTAEWPPHPDRLFMALAAAHFETDRDPAERSALLWLEQQAAPALHASMDTNALVDQLLKAETVITGIESDC